APARAADLFVTGDLGISRFTGHADATNDLVGITNHGSGHDDTPVWGGALGAVAPLSDALPWKWRMPGFGVPYWPGHEWRFREGDEMGSPSWPLRFEVEHLRGRDAEITTHSFNPLDSYRVDASAWTLMGKLRLDLPISAPMEAMFGRVPFL